MNIPKAVKVGGKVYKVDITTALDFGVANNCGECSYRELTIRLAPQHPQRVEACFLHELLHAIYENLGYTDHDEKQIDELANALHMVITDNPHIFTEQKKENKNGRKQNNK